MELNGKHKTCTTNLLNDLRIFFRKTLKSSFQDLTFPFADTRDIIFKHIFDRCDSCRTAYRVSSECRGAKQPWVVDQILNPHLRFADDTSDRHDTTAESFTIQLNAEGKPADSGDDGNWYYDPSSGGRLYLYNGGCTLKPSSESGAESALQGVELIINQDADFADGTVGCWTNNAGTISGGTFQKAVHNDATPNNQGFILDGIFKEQVHNWGTISGGIFQGEVHNWGTISGGTFEEVVEMNESPEGAKIEGGTFKKGIELNAYFPTITIKDGLFDGEVSAAEGYSGTLSISGGYFVNKPSLPVGSDTRFTTVSDQSYRTFQVPVNGDWSESGYNKLYVPNGSPAQPNTITVKTHTKLLYYLADGEQFPVPDSDSDSYVYKIPVQNYEKIVLVTEEPSAPPTDDPGELDPAFSSGAAALGIVLGTAGLGYITYAHISSLYLYYTLPGGFIPSTRQELANVLWTTAGKPDPVSTALYTDIPADAIEQQKAARWCVEQGLLSDYGATFGPDTKVTNARIIRAWNSLKKVPVTITK